ncbi:MAG: aspartyl/glutamyl-tRNA amidotransferase subunit A [Nitrospinae bacterium RIFCSPLOWO2_01_FULL_39_10]|nr:MAG: aspartyl/glutamyl-tRNA amidotransferase subunit A [Nitrospinae bacterium RIFCSPLOWO2_01_FULL_39_10]
MELYKLTIHELKEKLKRREISARELTLEFIKRIERVEKDIHSFITLTKDDALKQAEDIDNKINAGKDLPLLGIPLAIKDLICIRGVRTTCGSKILSNYIPPYDATVIKKMRESGAIFLGKLNMDEFAMGSSTETSHFGVTRNPWNLDVIPGGSSGGSAASVSADECAGSLGSDTGGSIRQPASMCGITGLKPTYGRVSRFGLVAFASSLDQIGPMTKDVTDTTILMNVISGRDPLDSTSADVPVPDFTKSLLNNVKGLKIGIPKEYFVEGMDGDVEKSVRDAVELFKKLGAEIKEVSLPHTDYAVSAYYVIAPAEASSNLARYDGVKYGYRTDNSKNLLSMYKKTREEGFGAEVKRRIMLGTYTLSSGYYDAYYLKAQKVRTLIKKDFDDAFKNCDILLTPTAPTPAFKIGEKFDNPIQMYLSDIFTISVNLAGVPAISIPCGFSKDGLPIGLQIIGRHFDEETIIRAAYTFEQNTDYHQKKPKIRT